jgi:hypothetical protein
MTEFGLVIAVLSVAPIGLAIWTLIRDGEKF